MRDQLEQFYKDNFETYCKRITRKTGGPENAEDIVQEAFYRALKFIDTAPPTGEKGMEVWFNTIVRRAMYDFKRIELKQGMTASLDSGEPEAKEATGLENVMADEILEEIENRKDPTHKQALFLYFVRNYPPRDIVQIIDIHVKNLHTIITRFKAEMGEKYGHPDAEKLG